MLCFFFYCGTKEQTDIKQNYSSYVHDNIQYKTNIHFIPQNYLANVRVTRGTNVIIFVMCVSEVTCITSTIILSVNSLSPLVITKTAGIC